MVIQDWVEDLEDTIFKIKEIAQKCGPEYEKICFEAMLRRALATENVPKISKVPSVIHEESLNTNGTRAFENFILDNSITREQLERLIDLDSGEVYVRNLRTTKTSEIQRKLGVLLGIYHLGKEGRAYVTQLELIEQCKKLGAYDSSNFSTSMKTAKHQDSVVFSKDGEGWKLTPTGLVFAVETIKDLSTPQTAAAGTI